MDLYHAKKARVEQLIGYLLITVGILGIVGFYSTFIAGVVFVLVGLLGVGFDSLAYLKKVPKESRPHVIKVLRGSMFVQPAKWIEDLFGFHEGNEDL